MKKVITILGAILFASVILTSCSNGAENSLQEILQITGNTFEGRCKVGNVYGSSFIKINEKNITVNYSAMGYSATESGNLENLEFRDDGERNTYRIKGEWIKGSFFRLEVSTQGKPNTAYLAIEGSGWIYYTYIKLSDEDFEKFINVLSKESQEDETENIKTDNPILTNAKEESVPTVEVIEKDDNTEYYIIEDPDGYSNLREVPGGKVVRKVYSSEKFEIIGEENKHKKVKLNDATTGYIHNSRVVNFNVKVCECLNSADLMIKKDLDKDFTSGSETGFPDNSMPSYTVRLLEIFRYNLCPKGCDFLADEEIIDFRSEIQRCEE